MKRLLLILACCNFFSMVLADDLTATVTNSIVGLNNGSIDLGVTGGINPYTFAWVGPAGFTSSDEDITGLAPGDYCVTVTDQYCGIATLCVFVDEEIATSVYPDQIISSVQLFPNPFVHAFSMVMDLKKEGNFTFRLTDLAGKTVFTDQRELVNGKNTIGFKLEETLPGGNYEMTMHDETGMLLSRSVVHVR